MGKLNPFMNLQNTATGREFWQEIGDLKQEFQELRRQLTEEETASPKAPFPMFTAAAEEEQPDAENDRDAEDELDEENDPDEEGVHPEHEGACEQSPEGVQSGSEEGEERQSLEPTEEEREEPENLLKAEAPPMLRRKVMRPAFQVSAQELRRSFVMNEVLGKPLSMRHK